MASLAYEGAGDGQRGTELQRQHSGSELGLEQGQGSHAGGLAEAL